MNRGSERSLPRSMAGMPFNPARRVFFNVLGIIRMSYCGIFDEYRAYQVVWQLMFYGVENHAESAWKYNHRREARPWDALMESVFA